MPKARKKLKVESSKAKAGQAEREQVAKRIYYDAKKKYFDELDAAKNECDSKLKKLKNESYLGYTIEQYNTERNRLLQEYHQRINAAKEEMEKVDKKLERLLKEL